MAKCIIFGAAGFDGLLCNIQSEDFVIAADGGVTHCTQIARTPDVILGDFDSLGYVPDGAQVFPVEKDDTDVMLAIRHGLDRGFREFWIYGGLEGPRMDHTMANLQALSYLCQHGAQGYLIGKEQIMTVIEQQTAVFPSSAEGIVSIFCMGEKADGIHIRGLHYCLENGTLTGDFPLGVSNHFTGCEAEISVKTGRLLLIWDRKNGLPTLQ